MSNYFYLSPLPTLNFLRPTPHGAPPSHLCCAPGASHALIEFGVGGGETWDYQTPARDWARAAAVPYWGVDGRYSLSRDPWARPGNRLALRRFYNATLAFADAGGGQTYKVHAAPHERKPRGATRRGRRGWWRRRPPPPTRRAAAVWPPQQLPRAPGPRALSPLARATTFRNAARRWGRYSCGASYLLTSPASTTSATHRAATHPAVPLPPLLVVVPLVLV